MNAICSVYVYHVWLRCSSHHCGNNCSKPLSYLESLVQDAQDVGAYSPGSGLFQAPGVCLNFVMKTLSPVFQSCGHEQDWLVCKPWIFSSFGSEPLCGGSLKVPLPTSLQPLPLIRPFTCRSALGFLQVSWLRQALILVRCDLPAHQNTFTYEYSHGFFFLFSFFQVVISLWKFYTMYAIPIHHTFFLCFFWDGRNPRLASDFPGSSG